MPPGGYQITQKSPPPKKKKAPAKVGLPAKPTGRQQLQAKQPGQTQVGLPSLRKAVGDAIDQSLLATPYRALPKAASMFPRETQAVSRAIGKTVPTLDPATAVSVVKAIPGTLRTPIHPGATHTPVEDVKRSTVGQVAQRIENPNPFTFKQTQLSAPYRIYFAGQEKVHPDELADAVNHFAQTPGSRAAGVPWPINDAYSRYLLNLAKKNGHDIRQAPHWTIDDLLTFAARPHHDTAGGYIRNTLGGLVQFSAAPQIIPEALSAGVAALGGDVGPTKGIGSDFWKLTKESNPLDPGAWYRNTPAVLANLLPATRLASRAGGLAAAAANPELRGALREIRLPATGMRVPQYVPADLLKRLGFEVKKNLIENATVSQRPGPLGAIGRGLEGGGLRIGPRNRNNYHQMGVTLARGAEADTAEALRVRAELARDQGLLPTQRAFGEAVRGVVKMPHTAGILSKELRPDKAATEAAQIVEQARTGLSPEEQATFFHNEAAKSRAKQTAYEENAKALRAYINHESNPDPAGTLLEAQAHEAEARLAALRAESQTKSAVLSETAPDVGSTTRHTAEPNPRYPHTQAAPEEFHPLVAAQHQVSEKITSMKRELSKEGTRSSLDEAAALHGDIEPMVLQRAQLVDDVGLHERAQSTDAAISEPARKTLAEAALAKQYLDTRQAAQDAHTRATHQRRTETRGGVSHGEAHAAGGLSEAERVAGREIGHIQTESQRLHEASTKATERLGLPSLIQEAPLTPHAPLTPGELAKISEDLNNITAVHIDREIADRRASINREFGPVQRIRGQLQDETLTPKRRADLQRQLDNLHAPITRVLNLQDVKPKTMRKIEREIDAYLKQFGRRLSRREKTKFSARKLAQEALTRQARGDLGAVSKRERKLESRVVAARANSSRAWRDRASMLDQQAQELGQRFADEVGRGSYARRSLAIPTTGGLHGFVQQTSRGVRARVRAPKIKRSTGVQQESGAYSIEQTIPNMHTELRVLSDMLHSKGLYDALEQTQIVRPSEEFGIGNPVPPGWHYVRLDDFQALTTHPSHFDISDKKGQLIANVDQPVTRQTVANARDIMNGIMSREGTGIIPHEPGYLIRDSALQALNTALVRHEAGDFSLLLALTNEYRKFLLFTLPRTFTNNMIGNIGLSLFSGASMADIVRAAKILRDHPEVLPSHIRNRGLISQMFGPEAAMGGWMDLWRRANTFAEDLGQAATYISVVRRHHAGHTPFPRKGGKTILGSMDDMNSEWYKIMDDLASGRDPNVVPFMKMSKQFFGDLALQTRQNKALSTGILFHRWVGHMIRLIAVTLPIHYPGRFALLLRISQLGDDYRKQHGVLPPWAAGVIKLWTSEVATPLGIQQVVHGLSTTGLAPPQTVSQAGDLGTEARPVFPGRTLISNVNPLIKFGIDLSTGTDQATGQPYRDQYGNPMSPGLDLAGHLVWAATPFVNTVASTAGTSADSQLLGAKHPRANSPAAYRMQTQFPYMIPARASQSPLAIGGRMVGVPVTALDSYGPRYNKHLLNLIAGLERSTPQGPITASKSSPPAKRPQASAPRKALTPAQVKAAQQANYAKAKKASAGGSNAKTKAAQQAAYEKAKKARGG